MKFQLSKFYCSFIPFLNIFYTFKYNIKLNKNIFKFYL